MAMWFEARLISSSTNSDGGRGAVQARRRVDPRRGFRELALKTGSRFAVSKRDVRWAAQAAPWS